MAHLTPVLLAANRAMSSAQRRLAQLTFPSPISALNSFLFPTISNTQAIAKSFQRVAPKRMRIVKAARTRSISVVPSHLNKIASRSFSLRSPLQLPQGTTVFMMFTRRQWWLFGGGLFVLGAGIVRNMEDKAIAKMLESLDDNLLNSSTLSFLTFRDAALLSSSLSRVIFAKNELIIRLACTAVTSDKTGPEVKAAAAWFLTNLLRGDDAYPLVIKHIDVAQLSSQFVKQIEKFEYNQSVAMILETAFSTKPPTADREAAAEGQRDAMIISLPLQTLSLLGHISKDKSTHASLLEEPDLVPRALQLLVYSTAEVPVGTELLYHLSRSNEGRLALIKSNSFTTIKDLAFDKSSPSYETFRESDFQPMFLRLVGIASNLYNHNLTELLDFCPQEIAQLADSEKHHLKTFDYEEALQSTEYIKMASGVVFSATSASVWGAIRGVVRNYYRKMGLSYKSAIASGATRAVIGAPLIFAGYFAANKTLQVAQDERLFITYSLVGSALSLFAARTLLLYAPFSLLPAAGGIWNVFGGSQIERRVRDQRLREFKASVQQPSEDLFTILERREDQASQHSK